MAIIKASSRFKKLPLRWILLISVIAGYFMVVRERLPKLPSRITYKTARTPMANHIAACTACTSFPILLSAHRRKKCKQKQWHQTKKDCQTSFHHRPGICLKKPYRYSISRSPPQSKALLQEVQTKRQTKSHTPVHGFQSRHTQHTLPSAIPESESGETTSAISPFVSRPKRYMPRILPSR